MDPCQIFASDTTPDLPVYQQGFNEHMWFTTLVQ